MANPSSLSTQDLVRAYLLQYVNGITGVATPTLNVPASATLVTITSGNVAAAVANAVLPAVAGKTNYLTGFEVTGSGATAGLPVAVSIFGLLGGTITYTYTAAVGVLVSNVPLIVEFGVPIPASAVNTAIQISCPSLGAGNTNNVANIHGYVV